MPTIDLRTSDGGTDGTVDLDDAVFSSDVNVPAMHQVVVAQLANARRDTAKTKNRTTVRGGGRKPYRQKGTGNARQGSIRAPQYSGGAIAHGRSGVQNHHLRVNKKLKRVALRSALSDRAATGDVVVISSFDIDVPRTKDALALLDRLELGAKRVLVVLAGPADPVRKSFGNIQRTVVLTVDQLNTYDVLLSDIVLFEQAALELIRAGATSKRRRGAADEPAGAPVVEPVVDQTVGKTDAETDAETDVETDTEETP
jgi:large subunit ribosomal protein L4